MILRLEAYTSNPKITKKEFNNEIRERVLMVEQELNKDGKFRFHIHEIELEE